MIAKNELHAYAPPKELKFFFCRFTFVTSPFLRIKSFEISEAPFLTESKHEGARPTEEIKKIEADLRDHIDGKITAPPIEALDISVMTPFRQKVLCELRNKIPAGEFASYGEFAKIIGMPGAGRAVGQAMAGNLFPIFFPCHRLIASGGKIGGFGPGISLKRRLLENESHFFPSNRL